MTEDDVRALFMPHLIERMAFVRGGGKLVHYTSAEAAFQIISSRKIWLRNAMLMNDFSEIQHGLQCLQAAWASPSGDRLKAWLDAAHAGLSDHLQSTFNAYSDGIRDQTFMLSLSEHDEHENELGRLSMWRAYGGRSGVALVLNTDIFQSEADALQVFSAPVVYQDAEEFQGWFGQWVDALISRETDLLPLGPERLFDELFGAFHTFALCLKHPGFREEREWRVFHSPQIEARSKWLQRTIETINGVPQEVLRVSLFDDAKANVIGVAPAGLLNRVIIGPCEHPLPIRAALVAACEAADVPEPPSMIFMSFIPLRT